jgi:DNA primase
MISHDLIEQVRCRVDAVALVGERVQLRRSGTSHVGCCPFHEEREGSFHLYPDEKRFACFGCGARGDVFEFLGRLEGKPFPVVVRELAAKVGVAVPRVEASPEQRRARQERAPLLAAWAAAVTRWRMHLWGDAGEPARRYLSARGVSEEVARSYRLGYSIHEWHDLERALAPRVPAAVLHAAGLVAKKEGSGKPTRFYDRFRHRLIFPIEDARGRVVGCGARAFDAEQGPKYLNTPETPLYKKTRTLYGLSRAREAIRRTRKAILVEGYFDVLVLHQAGFLATVASCGTALTREQVELLAASGCRELVLLFDGDDGGARAPAQVAPVLLQAGLSASVAKLPAASGEASDPDAFVLRAGKASLDEVLAGARPLTEYLIDDAIRRHAGGLGPSAPVEHKMRALRELTPLAAATPEGLARSTFERAIARRLDLDIGPLRVEVQRVAGVAEHGGAA